MNIKLSEHAKEKIIERSISLQVKIEKEKARLQKEIDTINQRYIDRFVNNFKFRIGRAKKVKPKQGALKLINHGFVNAEYYQEGDVVFVVVNNTVVTCLSFEYKKWEKI